MKNFTIDANDYDETNLNKTMIRDLIRKHSSVASKIRKINAIMMVNIRFKGELKNKGFQ